MFDIDLVSDRATSTTHILTKVEKKKYVAKEPIVVRHERKKNKDICTTLAGQLKWISNGLYIVAFILCKGVSSLES